MAHAEFRCPFSQNDVRIAARKLLGTETLPTKIEDDLLAATKRYVKSLKRLSRAGVFGRRHQQNALHKVHTCPSAKLIAFILGNQKSRSAMSWEQVKWGACQVRVEKPSGEPVSATQRLKRSGAFRWTCAFRRRARAAQRLIHDIIFVVAGPSLYEHSRRGRGRETAIRETLHGVKHKGVRWFGILDVKDFYPSVTREMVREVLNFLPASIIEATIFIHDETDITLNPYGKNIHSSAYAIRKGLPQGSLASAIVASKVLEKHLDTITARTLAAYVDNIVIGGKTKDEVQAMIIALASSLEGHPSGSLRLTTEIRRIGDPDMDILGYRIRRRSKLFGGFGRAQFSERSRRGHNAHLARKLLLSHDCFREAIIDNNCARWVRSFPAWSTRVRNEDIAVLEAYENLLPLVDAAKRALAHQKLKWTSFEDYSAHLTALARLIGDAVAPLTTRSGPARFKALPDDATPSEIFRAMLRTTNKISNSKILDISC